MRVAITRLAKADILRIRSRIAHDNPPAADHWVRTIRERVRLAGRSPRVGRKVPELNREDIREGIVGNYRVVYRIRPPVVEILRVFEGHMLLPHIDESRREVDVDRGLRVTSTKRSTHLVSIGLPASRPAAPIRT